MNGSVNKYVVTITQDREVQVYGPFTHREAYEKISTSWANSSADVPREHKYHLHDEWGYRSNGGYGSYIVYKIVVLEEALP